MDGSQHPGLFDAHAATRWFDKATCLLSHQIRFWLALGFAYLYMLSRIDTVGGVYLLLVWSWLCVVAGFCHLEHANTNGQGHALRHFSRVAPRYIPELVAAFALVSGIVGAMAFSGKGFIQPSWNLMTTPLRHVGLSLFPGFVSPMMVLGLVFLSGTVTAPLRFRRSLGYGTMHMLNRTLGEINTHAKLGQLASNNGSRLLGLVCMAVAPLFFLWPVIQGFFYAGAAEVFSDPDETTGGWP